MGNKDKIGSIQNIKDLPMSPHISFRSIVVIVVAVAIGEVVVEVGATCGSPGNHGIEARRRAWVDRFSSAPWVHDPPVGY